MLLELINVCTDPYRIYIEGIGTVSKETKNKTDDNDGYVYGRGRTGYCGKSYVSGCKMLARKNILEKKIKKKAIMKMKKSPKSTLL